MSENPSEDHERLDKEAEELARITLRQLYILVFAGFFLMLTLAGPDSQLVRADATISWPLIQTSVQLSTFLAYAPIALVGLHIYLHLFVERLIHLRRRGHAAPKTFVFEMTNPAARAVADLLLYAYVPLILMWFSWKVVFRPEAGLLIAVTSLVTFGSALLYYIRAIKGRSRVRRRIGLVALTLFSVVSLGGSAFVAIWNTEPILRLRQVELARANLGTSEEFPYVNLAETHLNHADMRFVRLSGADLREAHLSMADMSFARVGTATLEDTADVTDLQGAELAGTILLAADLRGASFDCAFLPQAQLPQASLGNTSFRGAVLDGSDLVRAVAAEGLVVFQEARLTGAKFSEAELSRVNFIDAVLRGAFFDGAHLSSVLFSNADLAGADLSNATFDSVVFDGADLRGADLGWSGFHQPSFVGANVDGAKFNEAEGVEEAVLSLAHLCNTIMPDGTERDDDCGVAWEEPRRGKACFVAPSTRGSGTAMARE